MGPVGSLLNHRDGLRYYVKGFPTNPHSHIPTNVVSHKPTFPQTHRTRPKKKGQRSPQRGCVGLGAAARCLMFRESGPAASLGTWTRQPVIQRFGHTLGDRPVQVRRLHPELVVLVWPDVHADTAGSGLSFGFIGHNDSFSGNGGSRGNPADVLIFARRGPVCQAGPGAARGLQ